MSARRDVTRALAERIHATDYQDIGEAARQAWTFGSPTYRVSVDGAAYEARSVVVAKARHYAGPFVIAPEARIEDPCFQVCLYDRGGPGAVLRYAFGLVSGRLAGMAGFRVVPARRVAIEGPAGDPVQCDGDILAHLPVEIDILEGAVSLIVPRTGS